MRRAIWLASVLLPLGGCYAPPAEPGYGYGYPPPGYPTPAPPEPYGAVYPGYSYNGGAPTFLDGGVAVPLVLFGGEWGYYDHSRHWHRAPDRVSHDLEAHRAGGGPFHPNMPPHSPPSGQPRPRQPGGPAAYRPAERPGPVARPQPAQAAPGRPQGHEHHRDCQPGQHC